MNEEGKPFRRVLDKILEIIKVITIPNITIKSITKEESKEEYIPKLFPTINIEEIVIKNEKRPLQGTKLLVSIETSISLGESIILDPITPAALQPKPHTHS